MRITAVLAIFLLIGPNLSIQEYVPGTPGAPWTEEEAFIVKAKLYAIFHRDGGHYALKQMYDDYKTVYADANGNMRSRRTAPNAAKVLRLGFHACLRYQDGSGGCNGCLNWDGVGTRFTETYFGFSQPNVSQTNNNGLGDTVDVLERIYEGNLLGFPQFT